MLNVSAGFGALLALRIF